MAYILRFFKFVGILCLFALAVLFFQFNGFAMQFAESWTAGTGWIVFLVLTGVEVLGFVLLFLAWYPKRSKLILRSNPTPEQMDAFAGEMRRRLRENELVRAGGVSTSDPEFVNKAVDILDKKAEEIIRSDSRKIFLGTALSQNGRLDALIVFIALARMVWRISRVYNQRPTPAEIWSVYSTVSSSAFIAFSIDALDIPSTVTEAMNSLFPAVAPHMAGTSVPFMGNAMHVFTSSMLDGAANGLLAVRAGILTKNAFRFATLDEPASRSMSTKEITQAMLALSKECLGDITIGLKDQVKGMAFNVADNCVEKTKGAAQTVASAVTDTVSSAGSMVARGGTAVVQAVGTGVETTAGATVLAAKTVSDTVSSAGSMVKRGGEAVGDAAVSAVRTVSDTVSSAGSMVKRGGEAVGDAAVSAVRTVSDTVSSAGSMVKRGGEAVGDAAVSAVRTVGGTVSAAGGKVVQGAEAVGNAAVSATSTVVRGGAAVVTGGIDATKKAVQGAGSVIGHFLPFRRGK